MHPPSAGLISRWYRSCRMRLPVRWRNMPRDGVPAGEMKCPTYILSRAVETLQLLANRPGMTRCHCAQTGGKLFPCSGSIWRATLSWKPAAKRLNSRN